MAKNKKSFVLYTDLKFTVDKLRDETAGKLFKHILDYVNDKNPIAENELIEIAFEPIKQSLKRDLKVWTANREAKRIGGIVGNLKRWNPDLYELYTADPSRLDELNRIAEDRKASHTDGNLSHTDGNLSHSIGQVAVSVSVSDNVKEESKDSNLTAEDLKNVLDQEKYSKFFERVRDSYYSAVEIDKTHKSAAYTQWKRISNQDKHIVEATIPYYLQVLKPSEKKYIKRFDTYIKDGTYKTVAENCVYVEEERKNEDMYTVDGVKCNTVELRIAKQYNTKDEVDEVIREYRRNRDEVC